MEFLYIGIPIILLIVVYFLFIKKKDSVSSETKKVEVIQQQKQEILCQLPIYYGSQQGTAAKLAKILSEDGQQFGFQTTVLDIGEVNFQEELTAGKVGIFLLATHGEGEPTDNAKTFMKWLATDQTCLKGFRYALFGLGNTQYEHYNKTAKDADKSFQQQGALRIFKYGEGDDNFSLEEDFNQWKENLWNELKEALKDLIEKDKLEEESKQEQQPLLEKRKSSMHHHHYDYSLEECKSNPLDLNNIPEEITKLSYEFQTKAFLKAKQCQILQIVELRQNNNDGSTLHLVIDLIGSNISYQTAQNLGIYPENDPTEVQELAKFLGIDLHQVISLQVEEEKQKKFKMPFPSPLTVEQILTNFCDITGPVMKKTLKDLAKLTKNEEVKQELEHLASHQGKDDFENKIAKHMKTIPELLKEYHIVPSLIEFVELCPRIAPRLFTIASSNVTHPNQIHIADSLLIDVQPNGQERRGLCTRYLERLRKQFDEKKKVYMRIDFRESSFKLPEDEKIPIIMIAAGTGVAPFIGFLEERESFIQNKQEQKQSQYLLFFGCKHENGDFIFKEKIKNFEQSQVLDNLYLAFSRDQVSSNSFSTFKQNKIYVQDLLLQQRDILKELILNQKANIYICGSTNMGKGVHQSLSDIVQKGGDMSEGDAHIFMKKLESDKRLIKELW